MDNYSLNRSDKSFDIMSSEGKVSASDSNIETASLCGACLERGGTQFCVKCDVVLCRTCTKSHKRLAATKNHILTDIPESNHNVTSELPDAEILRKIGVATISKLHSKQKEIDTIKENRAVFTDVSIKQHTLTKTLLEKMRNTILAQFNSAVDKFQQQQDLHIKYVQEGDALLTREANSFVDQTESQIPDLNTLRHAKSPDSITKTTTECKQLLTSMETWTKIAAIEAGKQTVEDYFPDMEHIMQELQQHISNIRIKPNYKMQRLQRRIVITNFGEDKHTKLCQSSQDEGDNLVLYVKKQKMVRVYSLNDPTSFTEKSCGMKVERMIATSSNRFVIQEHDSSILHLCDSNFQKLEFLPPTEQNLFTRIGPDYGRNGFIKCEGTWDKKGITVYRVDTNNDRMVQQFIATTDKFCLLSFNENFSYLYMNDHLLTLIHYRRAYRFDVVTSTVKEKFFEEICTEEDVFNAFVDSYANILICDDSTRIHLYKDEEYSVVQKLRGHGATGITVRNGCLILCCACAGCWFGQKDDLPFTLELYC